MSKKPSVPMTTAKKSIVPRAFEFNISKMLKNYYVARKVMAMLVDARLVNIERFFSGLVRGYDDWFESLGITQEVFDSLMVGFDVVSANKEADEVFADLVKKSAPEKRLIVPPTYSDVVGVSRNRK